MNKRKITGIAIAGTLLLAVINGGGAQKSSTKVIDKSDSESQVLKSSNKPTEKLEEICDGIKITSNCKKDGITYTKYIFHAAVVEKTHTETTTTYENKITGYCTLCEDGTYSPSCATGRGACSWHGGVKEWNSPIYTNTPVQNTVTIIDAPAKAEYYETLTK